jgi:hypothetical protein
MSTAWNRIAKMLGITIPTSIAMMALGSGVAWAQTTYPLEGSDTLSEVIQNAISGSHARIKYNNLGSGQGEKDMVHDSVYGAYNNYQGIAPMSRNFTGQVADPDCATRTPATCSPPTKPYMGHKDWLPTSDNVLGLDAGVLALKNQTGQCQDIAADLVDTADPQTAKMNTHLAVLLSGYPQSCETTHPWPNTTGCTVKSTATTAECASPTRLKALDELVACTGNRLDHIYRRDDNSGTQDTFREHLQFDRWCNGKSKGGTNSNPGSGVNLNNQDLDPIRRRCITSDYTYPDPNDPTYIDPLTNQPRVVSGTKAPTTCTFYPLATKCGRPGDPTTITDPTYGTLQCTQGLVVALSETDFGSKDITISIGNRVQFGGNNMAGLAGMASVNLDQQPTVGTTFNTVTYENDNVRAGQYMFSRRLFLQSKPRTGTPGNTVTVSGDPDTGRDVQEAVLFNWATNRCNIIDIVKNAGFLPPLDDCHQACNDPLNIACRTADFGIGTPNQNIGAEISGTVPAACDTTYPCVANGTVGSGTPVSCGGTGSNCPPIKADLGNGYACNVHDATHAGPKCTGSTSQTCALNSGLSSLAGVCQ